jgi:hypothetical protein
LGLLPGLRTPAGRTCTAHARAGDGHQALARSYTPGIIAPDLLVRPGEFGGRYVCELLVSLPDSSAL